MSFGTFVVNFVQITRRLRGLCFGRNLQSLASPTLVCGVLIIMVFGPQQHEQLGL